MTLTVLGCDGSYPGPSGLAGGQGSSGAASGYLVRSWGSGTALWVDAGPGTFANLQRFLDPLRFRRSSSPMSTPTTSATSRAC